ncbi:MAG: regulatory protein RecX [Tatlockia sp.]|nr:regulatory protein RecX [Tatlockia sp.]
MSCIIDVAIKRLAESSCSESELRLFLEKEFTSQAELKSNINSAIKRLKDLQLLNDLRLATYLAQHYAHKGDCYIAQILSQKGISEATIAEVLLSLENENVRALDVAREKLGNHWDSSEKSTSLLHRFLSGRRFSYAVINSVIGQLGDQYRCSAN